jgi:O-antigen/teichoic acid export membrane protein
MAKPPPRAGRNLLSNWTGLFLGIVISFFLSPYVVNKLGDAYYGLWAVLMQFTGYLNLLDFGVREAVIRNASRANAKHAERKLNRVYTVSLGLYSCIGVLCVLVSLIPAFALEHWIEVDPAKLREAQLAVVLSGATIGLSFVFNLYSGILSGFQRFDLSNSVTVPFQLIRAAAVVITLGAGYKIAGLAMVQLGVTIASGITLVIMCHIQLRKMGMRLHLLGLPLRRTVALAKKLLGYSVQVLISNIGQRITFASDALIVATFLPVTAVTYYAIAGSLIDYFRNFAVSTVQVFNPMASHHHALRQQDRIRGTLLSSTTLAQVLGMPILLAYMIFGEQFIGLWMGERFADASGAVLLALGLGMLLSPAHHAMASVLYGLGQPHIVARCRVAEAIANLTLSIVLVNQIGLLGVALGTTIPHLLLTGLLLPWYACKASGLGFVEFYLKVVGRCVLVSLPFLIGALLLNHYVRFPNLAVLFLAIGALTAVHLLTFLLLYFGIDGLRKPIPRLNSLLHGEFWNDAEAASKKPAAA